VRVHQVHAVQVVGEPFGKGLVRPPLQAGPDGERSDRNAELLGQRQPGRRGFAGHQAAGLDAVCAQRLAQPQRGQLRTTGLEDSYDAQHPHRQHLRNSCLPTRSTSEENKLSRSREMLGEQSVASVASRPRGAVRRMSQLSAGALNAK
jgi:hypothetical protein